MYRAVLCDDDEIILRGITRMTDWASLGIELVGTGSNGVEAFELIDSLKPDILITDIRMPFHDGFDIIARAKAANPSTVVILSLIHI